MYWQAGRYLGGLAALYERPLRGNVPALRSGAVADERQAQLRAIASELISWKGGLKVLRIALLPKWRGHFKWQIEEKIEALQAAYATLRAEVAKPDE